MPDSTQDMSMAVNIPPNAPPHIYAAAAAQFLEWGRADGALQVSQLGLERHPNYTGLRMFRAEALILHRRPEQGEEDLRAVLAAEPQHPRAVKVLAHLLMTQRRFKEAVPLLERAEFICVGDSDIPQWLAAAQEGAKEEEESPSEPEPSALMASETIECVRELTSLGGVLAVSLSDGRDVRCLGKQSEQCGRALSSVADLETEMSGILSDVGFGRLTVTSLHDADRLWTSRLGKAMTARVAAEAGVREGLISWHLDRLLEDCDG